MKTLLCVITHPEARSILEMNWPWLQRACADVKTVNHEGAEEAHWYIGGPPGKHSLKWLGRFLLVAEYAVKMAPDCQRFIFCESDTIFVRPVPEDAGTGATLAGYASDGFVSTQFFHCPWVFTAADLGLFMDRARRITRIGMTEQGFIDRFLGLYEDLYGPVIAHHPNYSLNTIGMERVAEAREAIAKGAWALHGVKSPEVLAKLTEGL